MASLVADYGDSSLESTNDETSSSENEELSELHVPAEIRLPPPTFTDKIKNSVFVNPYLEAENAKIAVLEKHVKMVPIEKPKTGTENKVCWMFKKGSCRYGKKCKFKHIVTTTDGGDEVLAEAPAKSPGKGKIREPENVKVRALSADEEDEEPRKKKKRPGLTKGLVPSKRVMKMYKKNESA